MSAVQLGANGVSPLEAIREHPGAPEGIRLYLKRDDLLHPEISGNKWRKLAPVAELLRTRSLQGVLSFGGPFSNHLHALAAAGKTYGFPTAAIVRGETADASNPTLSHARRCGMQLFFIAKKEYDLGEKSPEIQRIAALFPQYYHLPEGGNTIQAVQSCARITLELEAQLPADRGPLFVGVPAGTGCTAAGIAASLQTRGALLVFPAAPYGVSPESIENQARSLGNTPLTDLRFFKEYSFGKFATPHPELLEFEAVFRRQTGILLDPIYTLKMMYGLFDLLRKAYFPPGSCIVALHTGGLQGWDGFRQRFLSLPGNEI